MGDAVYADTAPSRPPSVTFLRGDVIITVTMTHPLSLAAAKQLATLVVARLPASAAEPVGPPSHPPASGQVASSQMPLASPVPPVPPSIDAALVSTWKFDGFMADMFWVVRTDDSYRLHGWGAGQQQRGRFEGAQGQWSINAPNWQDSGTYILADAGTWVVTGKFGTGTWNRVWYPGQPQQHGLDTAAFATCCDPPKWLVCWTRRWSTQEALAPGTATQEKCSKGAATPPA